MTRTFFFNNHFSLPTLLDDTRTPQSIHAPPLTSQSACTKSIATLPFTLPLSNPRLPSNLFTSFLTRSHGTQSIHAVDITLKSARMPNMQQLTLLFSSTPQTSAHLYNITEDMHALPPPTSSSLHTIFESRDIRDTKLYPDAVPFNPTIPQLYMQKTEYHFQIAALDYTKDRFFFTCLQSN